MANPQKENGSTDIANELLEAIYSSEFNGTEYAVLLCILRYTYGFHRKKHELSLNFIAKATKRHKVNVSKTINNLIAKNILIEYCNPSYHSTREIGINKDYNSWSKIELVNSLTVSQSANSGVSQFANSRVSQFANQETKNKTKNKTKNIYVEKSTLKERFDALWMLYPRKEGKANAFKKYQRVCKNVEDEKIKKGILNYVERIKRENTDAKYIKMGSTWFNGECWNDEYKIEERVERNIGGDNTWQ